jgi:hypothetical protein
MTRESDYWSQTVKPRLDKAKLISRRIENSASAGIPDVSIGVKDGGYLWAELKIGNGNKFSLKKYQYAYFIASAHNKLGHLNFIVVKDYGVIDANSFSLFHEVIRTNTKDVFVRVNIEEGPMDLDMWIEYIPNLFTF